MKFSILQYVGRIHFKEKTAPLFLLFISLEEHFHNLEYLSLDNERPVSEFLAVCKSDWQTKEKACEHFNKTLIQRKPFQLFLPNYILKYAKLSQLYYWDG